MTDITADEEPISMIQYEALPDLEADTNWSPVFYPTNEEKRSKPLRRTQPLVDTLRALGKTPNGRFVAHTGRIGKGLYQGRKAINSSPINERRGSEAAWNSDANRIRAMAQAGLVEVWKRPAVGEVGPAVMFVMRAEAWEVLRRLPEEPERRNHPVKLDIDRKYTDHAVDQWHDSSLPLGTAWPATRGDEGDWDPVSASWEMYEGVGPGGIAKQLKITRRSPIGPRAPLLAYVGVDAGDIAKVLREFADYPEPSDRTHITETVRFLNDLDQRAVMGWLQTQARSTERRNDMAEALMFGDLEKDDLIVEAIELTWPGPTNGKHRRAAMENIRLLVAHILVNLIQRQVGMVLLSGPAGPEPADG